MAIKTMYRGIEYRSRLEAKWAAFFANIAWQYTYEPFDGAGYIPDFLIHGERPLLVEVKPAVTLAHYTAATAKAENGLREWDSDILIVGADPLPRLKANGPVSLAAGLLGEFDGEGWVWGTAAWFLCTACCGIAVLHDELSYTGRPCGHYDGDRHVCRLEVSNITDSWAAATNRVKWEGRAA